MATWATELTHLRNILEEATASIWADATLLEYYNQGLRDVAAKTKFRLQETVVSSTAGTATYARPSYDMEPYKVYIGTTVLDRESPQEWAGHDLTASGSPLHYAVIGATLHFRPIPNVGASIHYWSYRYPAPVSGTATVTLPDELIQCVREYTLSKAYEQVENWDACQFHKNTYQEYLADALQQSAFQRQGDFDQSPTEVW